VKPYFDTEERIARLVSAAEAWKGTPWRANSSARGVGVSCHNLPRALYIESGAILPDFPKLESTPSAVTAFNYMEIFLNARSEFQRVNVSEVLTGDLLGMFIPIDSVGRRLRQRCVNHLGIALPQKQLVHTLLTKNTGLDQFSIPPWSQIIIAAWRPLES
jgi:cell wall-associated NlpC family hydrolase